MQIVNIIKNLNLFERFVTLLAGRVGQTRQFSDRICFTTATSPFPYLMATISECATSATSRIPSTDSSHVRTFTRWSEAILRSAIGCKLEFTLASRSGNPEAVRHTTIQQWPIT